jgi:hypothetical protein
MFILLVGETSTEKKNWIEVQTAVMNYLRNLKEINIIVKLKLKIEEQPSIFSSSKKIN